MADNQGPPPNKRHNAAMYSWERLPDDVWHKIFTYLYRHHRYAIRSISLTCKSFLALSNRAVTFFTLDSRFKTVPLPFLLSRFSSITSFQLCSDPNLEASVTLLANAGAPLESLCLSHQTHFPKEAMRLLAHRMCSTLRSLSCIAFAVITDDDLALIAECFTYLRELNIKVSSKKASISDAGMLKISTALSSLVSLNVNVNMCLTHRSFEYLVSKCFLLRQIGFGSNFIDMDRLDRLDLFRSLSSLELTRAKISRRVLVELSEFNLKLERLVLIRPTFTDEVTSQILCEFFRSCRSLGHLVLKCRSFPAHMNANEFAASLPKIQVIHLLRMYSSVPLEILLCLLKHCPLLEEIYMDDLYMGTYFTEQLHIRTVLGRIEYNKLFSCQKEYDLPPSSKTTSYLTLLLQNAVRVRRDFRFRLDINFLIFGQTGLGWISISLSSAGQGWLDTPASFSDRDNYPKPDRSSSWTPQQAFRLGPQ